MGKNPIQTIAFTLFNQAHNLECMKWMRNERKKKFRPLTKGLKLDRGRKYDGKKDFGENGWFGSREKREISRYLSLK